MWIMTSKRNSGYRVAREPFYFQVRLSAGQQESVRNCQIWHPFVYIVSNEVVNFKEGVKLQLWINFTWNYSLQIFNCIGLRQCIMSRGQNIVVGDIEFVEVQNCSKTRMIKSDSSLTDVQPINRNSRVVPLTSSWTSYPESEMRSRTTAFCNRDERGLDGWAPPTANIVYDDFIRADKSRVFHTVMARNSIRAERCEASEGSLVTNK